MVKADEEEFCKVLESRTKNGEGKLKIVDVHKNEREIVVREMETLHQVQTN